MADTASAKPAPAAKPRIRDLIEVAGRLVVLMREETAALRAMSFARVAELGPEKAKLVEGYTTLARQFHRDPETLSAVAEAVRAELRDALAEFEATAHENERMLTAAREANERVLRAVVEAAESQRPRAQGYGRTGVAVGGAGAPRGGAALSLALDRQL